MDNILVFNVVAVGVNVFMKRLFLKFLDGKYIYFRRQEIQI